MRLAAAAQRISFWGPIFLASGCDRGSTASTPATGAAPVESVPASQASSTAPAPLTDTCTGPYASYWDDPSNTPPSGSEAFRLSQAFPKTLPEGDVQPWLAANPFTATTPQQTRSESDKYIRAILSEHPKPASCERLKTGQS